MYDITAQVNTARGVIESCGRCVAAERRAQLQKSRSRAQLGGNEGSREIENNIANSIDTPKRPERRNRNRPG